MRVATVRIYYGSVVHFGYESVYLSEEILLGLSQSLNDGSALRSHQSYRRKLHPLLLGEGRPPVVHGYTFSVICSIAHP